MNLKGESKLLAKHSVIYGVGDALKKIAAFLLLPLYTTYLTPTDYGIKELVGLSVDVIGILLATAVSSSIFRFYFEYKEERERNEVISSAVITIAVFGFLVLAGLSFFSKLMAEYILNSESLYYYFLIAFASMWFQSIVNIAYNYLRANQKSLTYTVYSMSRLILALTFNIYFVAVLKYGVLGILISTLISSVVMFFAMVLPLLIKIKLRFSFSKVKELVVFGAPLIPAQLGAFVVHLSDRFFIKGYVSIAEAGIYSLGYRFGTLPGTFISDPFNRTWQPRRFELYKEEDSEKIFGRIFTYFLAIITFAGLGVAVLTKDVLMVIADKPFWSAYQIVPIIVLSNIIFTFHYHFNMGILIAKKTKYFAYINFSNGVLVILLNFLLIPKFGIFGAAYATLFAFIYKVSLTYYFSSKFYKIHFEFGRIMKIILTGFVLFGISFFIHIDNIGLSILVKMLLILIFPLALWNINLFDEEEKNQAREFISSKLKLLKVKR